jgi:hypothetical protein
MTVLLLGILYKTYGNLRRYFESLGKENYIIGDMHHLIVLQHIFGKAMDVIEAWRLSYRAETYSKYRHNKLDFTEVWS